MKRIKTSEWHEIDELRAITRYRLKVPQGWIVSTHIGYNPRELAEYFVYDPSTNG